MSSNTFVLKSLNTSALANRGVVCTFRHPETNEKLPLSVTVLGGDSEAYRRVSDASLNAVFKDIAKGKKANRTAADVREERLNAVVDCITAWDGYAEGENVLECTKENKLEIFGDPGYGWMLDYVDEFIRDRANFLPK